MRLALTFLGFCTKKGSKQYIPAFEAYSYFQEIIHYRIKITSFFKITPHYSVELRLPRRARSAKDASTLQEVTHLLVG